jgi:hypothetical protein
MNQLLKYRQVSFHFLASLGQIHPSFLPSGFLQFFDY